MDGMMVVGGGKGERCKRVRKKLRRRDRDENGGEKRKIGEENEGKKETVREEAPRLCHTTYGALWSPFLFFVLYKYF